MILGLLERPLFHLSNAYKIVEFGPAVVEKIDFKPGFQPGFQAWLSTWLSTWISNLDFNLDFEPGFQPGFQAWISTWISSLAFRRWALEQFFTFFILFENGPDV